MSYASFSARGFVANPAGRGDLAPVGVPSRGREVRIEPSRYAALTGKLRWIAALNGWSVADVVNMLEAVTFLSVTVEDLTFIAAPSDFTFRDFAVGGRVWDLLDDEARRRGPRPVDAVLVPAEYAQTSSHGYGLCVRESAVEEGRLSWETAGDYPISADDGKLEI